MGEYKGEERRKTDLSANEKIIVLTEQYKSVTDSISRHKIEHDKRFDKLQSDIEQIKEVLIPKDGKPSIPEKIRVLEGFKNHLIAIWLLIITGVINTLSSWLFGGKH
ncbi:hypothetical protein EKK58_10030 [Candidatus Dependentiae bacterium]|nr:MAG: hypothetical protein EKK58_10030 [Candidatus Dependentiae bacterium]